MTTRGEWLLITALALAPAGRAQGWMNAVDMTRALGGSDRPGWMDSCRTSTGVALVAAPMGAEGSLVVRVAQDGSLQQSVVVKGFTATAVRALPDDSLVLAGVRRDTDDALVACRLTPGGSVAWSAALASTVRVSTEVSLELTASGSLVLAFLDDGARLNVIDWTPATGLVTGRFVENMRPVMRRPELAVLPSGGVAAGASMAAPFEPLLLILDASRNLEWQARGIL